MTRDEILNTPAGKEMNELVALHVFDWGKHMNTNGVEVYVNKDTGKPVVSVETWEPSTAISNAWHVVDFLTINLDKYKYVKFKNAMNELTHGQILISWEMCTAICRAALIATLK